MKTPNHYTDIPHGARFTVLLLPLFAAAALAVLGLVYPMQIDRALDHCSNQAPLANPTVVLSAGIGEPPISDTQTLSGLYEIGDVTSVVTFETETADGIRVQLLSVDSTAMADAFVLTDGRMPQNETECVIVSLDASMQTASEIGSVIRPCGKDGEVLTDSRSNSPCALTVVGIGENIHSVLAPITDNATQLMVYTVSDACWQNPDTTAHLYLSDCKTDDPLTAVKAVQSDTADARKARLAALAEERLQACLTAAELADSRVTAQEITVQEIENRLATANLRVTEAETNMMDAIAALQAEKQEFVSDMEYNEYYALRQVDLIPRRDRAEEGYAKQEAVIAQMNTDLHSAYADRDVIAVELQNAAALLAALQTEADDAQLALKEQQNNRSSLTHAWKITTAEEYPGCQALQTHAAAVRSTALLLSAVALGVYLVGSITVYAFSHRVTCSVPRALFSAILIAVPAILFGGCMLSKPIFAYVYPALRSGLILPMFTEGILVVGAAVLLTTAVISIGVTAIGRRMQRIQQTPAQK